MKRIVALWLAGLVAISLGGLALAGVNRNFSVHATGDLELPVRDTQAQGQAIFHLGGDGTSVEYKVVVANIENVTQSHIHCGPPTENGPIVVWLYPSAPPLMLIPGRSDGILAQGTFTNANVMPAADSAICPGGVETLDDVIAKMRSGGAYVNVHTTQFPPGEIRGNFR
jgi:hypothetical protein